MNQKKVRVSQKYFYRNIIAHYKDRLSFLKKGDNVLFDFGKSFSLMKYEGFDIEVLGHNEHRYNRQNILGFFSILSKQKEKSDILEKININIYGTHKLDFFLMMNLKFIYLVLREEICLFY